MVAGGLITACTATPDEPPVGDTKICVVTDEGKCRLAVRCGNDISMSFSDVNLRLASGEILALKTHDGRIQASLGDVAAVSDSVRLNRNGICLQGNVRIYTDTGKEILPLADKAYIYFTEGSVSIAVEANGDTGFAKAAAAGGGIWVKYSYMWVLWSTIAHNTVDAVDFPEAGRWGGGGIFFGRDAGDGHPNDDPTVFTPAIFHSTIVAENIVRLDGNANPTGKDINDLDTGILTPTFQYSIDVDNSFNNFIGINDTITIGLFTFDFNGFVDDRNCTGSPTTCNWVGTGTPIDPRFAPARLLEFFSVTLADPQRQSHLHTIAMPLTMVWTAA